MADVTQVMTNSAGFSQVIDYREFLHDLYLDLRGQSSSYQKVGSETLADGTTKDLWEEKIQDAAPGAQIVNEAGAKYIQGQLKLFFNKHIAMGSIITNRECAQIAADASVSIFSHIEYNSSVYGCDEEKFSQLEGIFDNVMRTLYLFLTSLTGGAMRNFGQATTSQNASYNANENANQQKTGLGKIFG